ncbi:hypothetical protein N7457_004027 [Penicillium paradoxum]|uniref:uncharacterized protein n=1 Tax=Penicillium paradoxum TaxID=176176 RepID=UPI0025499CE6|nr:uncharacterized protein N7457_004027 [Penicillium paradoxum]KAJ5782253.1 hypothetical protein N7457_004027 [Penicillium paradoxum]
MDLEPADIEVRLELDDNMVARIVTYPVIPWVLHSIEDNFDEDSNLPPPPTILHRNYHPSIPRTGARRAPATTDTSPSSSSTLSVQSETPSPSPSHDTRESYLSLSELMLINLGSTLVEQAEDLVHRTTTNSLTPFVEMESSNHSEASSSQSMAPPSQVEDQPNLQAWESHRPSSDRFTIYEDPTHQEPTHSSLQLPVGPILPDENQENTVPADYISSDEDNEQQTPANNWDEASVGPRDAFGLPLNPPEVSPSRANANTHVNWPTQNGRQVLRPIWAEADATDDESVRSSILNDSEDFNVDSIEVPSPGGPRTRVRFTRRGPSHETELAQQPVRQFPNVRRALDFHANGTLAHTPEVDEGNDADDEGEGDGEEEE